MTAASPSDLLGYDMKVGEDLTPEGRSATGLELVADAMLHRLTCGVLLLTGAPDDQTEFGEDVRTWIGEVLTQDSLNAKAPLLEQVLRRDPRISTISLSLEIANGNTVDEYDFYINVQAITNAGQRIDRVIGVSQVTVEFLAQGT